mmetsp:Transcript_4347/g.16375  ORF Transcript_4347/g.16375 Transcript_4347/m.16375 type:complete len:242 (+) Transcript_4347:1136-1861(+)
MPPSAMSQHGTLPKVCSKESRARPLTMISSVAGSSASTCKFPSSTGGSFEWILVMSLDLCGTSVPAKPRMMMRRPDFRNAATGLSWSSWGGICSRSDSSSRSVVCNSSKKLVAQFFNVYSWTCLCPYLWSSTKSRSSRVSACSIASANSRVAHGFTVIEAARRECALPENSERMSVPWPSSWQKRYSCADRDNTSRNGVSIMTCALANTATISDLLKSWSKKWMGKWPIVPNFELTSPTIW